MYNIDNLKRQKYRCNVCEKNHYTDTAIGKSHFGKQKGGMVKEETPREFNKRVKKKLEKAQMKSTKGSGEGELYEVPKTNKELVDEIKYLEEEMKYPTDSGVQKARKQRLKFLKKILNKRRESTQWHKKGGMTPEEEKKTQPLRERKMKEAGLTWKDK